MTLEDIKNEVAALGFERELATDAPFVFAVRRALMFAYAERGVHKSARLFQRMPMPEIRIKRTDHDGSGEERFTLPEGVYAFSTAGTGYFTVSDENGTKTVRFDANLAHHTGNVVGDGVITFGGEYSYTVYELCHFKERLSPGVSTLCYGNFCEYDLEELTGDFLGAADVARDERGKMIPNAVICSGKLRVPYTYVGEIRLKYKCTPPEVSADAPGAELAIDAELVHLIPLLTASFVWLDDDAEKARYYASLYRDGMAALKLYNQRCVCADYTDVTGWA